MAQAKAAASDELDTTAMGIDENAALFGEPQVEGGDDFGDMPLDLSQVSSSGFPQIPPGVYDGYMDIVEYGQSQADNPMITMQIIVDVEGRERRVYNHNTLNQDAGLSRIKRTLERLAPEVDLTSVRPKEIPQVLEGKTCRVRIRNQKGRDGETRPSVQDVMAPIETDSAESSLLG